MFEFVFGCGFCYCVLDLVLFCEDLDYGFE